MCRAGKTPLFALGPPADLPLPRLAPSTAAPARAFTRRPRQEAPCPRCSLGLGRAPTPSRSHVPATWTEDAVSTRPPRTSHATPAP